MAHKLKLPLITVSRHEDLSASDLIGRYVIQNDEVLWSDGPMTAQTVRWGRFCIWMKSLKHVKTLSSLFIRYPTIVEVLD